MKSFNYDLVKDLRYFRDWRLDEHSDHPFYASHDDYEAGENSFVESLNGLWKFHYARNYESTVNGFEKADYDCHSWEGTTDIKPGETPTAYSPVASYVK